MPIQMLESLPNGVPFPFNYGGSRIDRNALYALNEQFDPSSVSAIRTKYHRSNMNFEDLKLDLLEYNHARPRRQHSAAWYAVFESVRRDLDMGEKTCVPLTISAVAKHPDLPKSKSPGLPYKLQGYKTKGEAVSDPSVMSTIHRLWHNIEGNIPVPLADVACYGRAHIATRDKNKIRSTWGYPLEVYMAEACYFYPILENLKSQPNPIVAYGTEIGNGGMTFVNTMAEHFPTRPILLGDWSKFDKTVPSWLVRDAFRILAESIDFSHVTDENGVIKPVNEARAKRKWKRLVQYFIDTPIRLSNGERYIKHCGIPSGSCFTNIIDSIVNALVMRYLTYELSGDFPKADIYLGDDSVIILPTTIDLVVLANLALEQFGMIFNVEKSQQVKDRRHIHFLGYYNDNGMPYRPLDILIASTIYPEQQVTDKVDTITRLVGQALACFDPSDASRFLRAADILKTEERLGDEDISNYIRQHPGHFKYLATLGINPREVSFPTLLYGVDTWRTVANANRRCWRFRDYHVSDLYARGMLSYERLSGIIPIDESES